MNCMYLISVINEFDIIFETLRTKDKPFINKATTQTKTNDTNEIIFLFVSIISGRLFRKLSKKNVKGNIIYSYKFEASNPKWVNLVLNIIWVNSVSKSSNYKESLYKH